MLLYLYEMRSYLSSTIEMEMQLLRCRGVVLLVVIVDIDIDSDSVSVRKTRRPVFTWRLCNATENVRRL